MLTKSELSFDILDGFNSCDVSSDMVRPALSNKTLTILPRIDLVMVHLFPALTLFVKAAIPPCLEAASLLIVCSSVRSTGLHENEFDVRRMESAPPSNILRIPSCVCSIFIRFRWYCVIHLA